MGTDLSAGITWVGLGLSAAEPHELLFLCTCQLDLEIVNEFRSIERFSTADTVQHDPYGLLRYGENRMHRLWYRDKTEGERLKISTI